MKPSSFQFLSCPFLVCLAKKAIYFMQYSTFSHNDQCKKTKDWLEPVDIPQQTEKEPIWHIKERVEEDGCGCLKGFADEKILNTASVIACLNFSMLP